MRIGVTIPGVHETPGGAVDGPADEIGFDPVRCNDHLALPAANGDSSAAAGPRADVTAAWTP